MKRSKENAAQGNSTKEVIRAAAAELFAQKGYAASSTREICQRAGITKPALYYHFGNKEQLYEELVMDAFNEYQKELRRASHRGRTPRETLAEVVTAIFGFARHKHLYWRIGFRQVFAPEKESPSINYVEMSQTQEKILTDVVREGIRRREIRGKAEFIAEAISGISISCIEGYLLTGKPALDRSMARSIVDLLIEGCGRNSTHR